ncbi:MAG: type 1 glutamine amidotransferase-like domain-containing protein [Candidatus Moranbacteria bacterium]|nr:type 1 glutamine amidotransferase-like domain-containing protein [Candidatus Moranbacteria bacterium]
MRFYLSSYKFGNETASLVAMLPSGKRKIAYISNALDFSDDIERRRNHEQTEIDQLAGFGFSVERVDLRHYFDRRDTLETRLSGFDAIWACGGNVFVLRQAMKLSGLDDLLKGPMRESDMLYGGYSAGVCVLGPTLRGLELVDDPTAAPYGSRSETEWDGVDVLDYVIVPHYRSDHPETEMVEEVIRHMTERGTPFKTLRDGEVIIIR